ncbi:MAG: stage II sporulation protein D [Oscillospiraceae bacterium]|nr:stage II sporulation protein D [Oscillospiraceae bacterium]
MSDSRFRTFAAAAVLMLALPALSAKLPAASSAAEQRAEPDEPAVTEDAACYRVLRTATGKIEEIPVRDYLIGVVGAEMPAAYEPEALKAQAIAAHTYAERIRMQNRSNPDAARAGYDFSDDSSSYQAFFSPEQMRTFYGDAYEESREKIAAAVDAVSDILLYYENEPIVAAFHAVSAGQTESAEAVWGAALPYLVSVSSAGDCDAPQYETVQCVQPDALKKALREIRPAVIFGEEPAQWFGEPSCTAAGTVLHVQCGSEDFTGQELREALSLRSACFTVKYDDMQFIFTVKGYGHAVGMSQYGANVMAKEGQSYAEILQHYYPGAELIRNP